MARLGRRNPGEAAGDTGVGGGDGPGAGDGGGGLDNANDFDPNNPGFLNEILNTNQDSAQNQAADVLQAGVDRGLGVLGRQGRLAGAEVTAGADRAADELGLVRDFGFGRHDELTGGIDQTARDLRGIRRLVSNPERQVSFLQNNPFFQALASDAQQRIFGNAAARGKVGSGGTAEALQNSIMLLGDDLLNSEVNRRSGVVNQGLELNNQNFGIVGLGANAAGEIAGIREREGVNRADIRTLTSGRRADLIGAGASAEAAGIIGTEIAEIQADNARSDRNSDMIQTGIIAAAAALSDRRHKTDIYKVSDGDIPTYFFKYKDSGKLEFGVMAQDVPHATINAGGKLYVDYSRL